MAFSVFGVGVSSFQSPCSPVLFLLHVFLYHHSISVSVFLSLGVHPLSSSMFSLPHLPLSFSPQCQSRFSNFLNYVCHTYPYSYILSPYLLGPLYFYYPAEHFRIFLARPAQPPLSAVVSIHTLEQA